MATKNFDAELMDLDGKPITYNEKNLTLGLAALTVLFGNFPGEENLPGEQKADRFDLALRVHKGGEQELKHDEIDLLKRLIGKGWGPLVVGRAYEALS